MGADAPDFALTDVLTGKTVRRDDFRGQKGLLVMFICTHCPYVKHVEKGLAALGMDYDGEPVSIVAISSNDAKTYPDDSPEGLKQQAQGWGFAFHTCTTRRRTWRAHITRRARRICFCSMGI